MPWMRANIKFSHTFTGVVHCGSFQKYRYCPTGCQSVPLISPLSIFFFTSCCAFLPLTIAATSTPYQTCDTESVSSHESTTSSFCTASHPIYLQYQVSQRSLMVSVMDGSRECSTCTIPSIATTLQQLVFFKCGSNDTVCRPMGI